jgi:hypothetical protein
MLLRQVVTDDATRDRSNHRVVTGGVTGDAADYRALDAALGIGLNRRHRKCHDRKNKMPFHFEASSV